MHSGLGLILNRNKSLFKGLLDNFSGASAAYSLRRLAKGEGEVVRVRRASDNAQKDFSAAAVASGAMTDWVGAGNDGFVTKWYDQSGNGNDAVQTTAASQPKIVDAGSLIASGCVRFNLTSLNFDSAVAGGEYNIFAAYSSQNGGYVLKGTLNSPRIRPTSTTVLSVYTYSPAVSQNFTVTAVGATTLRLDTIRKASNGDAQVYRNGTESTSGTLNVGTGVTGFSEIGRVTDTLDIDVCEIIIYESDQSSNRTAIEANIADEYGITLS